MTAEPPANGRGAGLAAAVDLLACPHCAQPLRQVDGATAAEGVRPAGPRVLGCPTGHRFDVARQGHVSLLGPRARTDTGDTSAMVAARQRFLGRGHYAPVTAALAEQSRPAGPVVEIGAGPGHHLRGVLDARVDGPVIGVALDSSAGAARRAAADPRVAAVVADAWAPLPVRDGAAAVVLSVFAPRTVDEVTRVLRPGGVLVAVTPEPGHLAELRDVTPLLTVDAGKSERLADAFAGRLRLIERVEVAADLQLRPDDVADVIGMGPTAHHLDATALREVTAGLPELTRATLAVTVTVLQRPS